MRRPSVLLALVATAVVAAPVLAAEVALRSQWDGCGEGSWVIHQTTAKSQAGDQPANETVTVSRSTLVKVSDRAYTVKTEMKVGEDWVGADTELPRFGPDPTAYAADAKVEELGTETLTVDGEALECRKTKVTAGDAVSISWVNAKFGQVKSESRAPAGETTMELVRLKSVVKVKGKDVECLQWSTKMKSPQMEMSTVMFNSDAVPGGSVRVESSMKMPGVMENSSVMEISDFVKK